MRPIKSKLDFSRYCKVDVGSKHEEMFWDHTPPLQHKEKSNIFDWTKIHWTHKLDQRQILLKNFEISTILGKPDN